MAGEFSRVANGTIFPKRLVKIDTTTVGRVLACTGSTDQPMGISQAGTRRMVAFDGSDITAAAIAGEPLQIYAEPMDSFPLLELGGTVTAGDFLTSDANGAGVTTTSGSAWTCCQAQLNGVIGEAIPVRMVAPRLY